MLWWNVTSCNDPWTCSEKIPGESFMRSWAISSTEIPQSAIGHCWYGIISHCFRIGSQPLQHRGLAERPTSKYPRQPNGNYDNNQCSGARKGKYKSVAVECNCRLDYQFEGALVENATWSMLYKLNQDGHIVATWVPIRVLVFSSERPLLMYPDYA